MYGLSFVASLFCASATLRFASAIRLPTSSAKCAEAAVGPGLRGCAGTGVFEAALADPERMAASFAAISARFCAISASFCHAKSKKGGPSGSQRDVHRRYYHVHERESGGQKRL
jgi:hypothetical protein